MKHIALSVGKYCTYTIIVLALILTLILAYLFSPLATPLFRWASNSFVENLTIQEISGSLYSGLRLDKIKYNTDALSVEIGQLNSAVDWKCSSLARLCVNSIRVRNPNIRIEVSKTDDAPPTPAAKEFISLPIELKLKSIDLSSLQFASGDLSLTLAQLHTQVTFSDVLAVNNTQLSELHIHSTAPSTEPKPFTGLSYTAPTLPDVWIPIHAKINELDIKSVHYSTEASEQVLPEISLASSQIQGGDISWKKLIVTHSQGNVTTSGNITLEQNFPLNASLNVNAQLENDVNQQGNFAFWGALDALSLKADISGLVTGNAELKLNILDNELPVEGLVHWPEQAVNYATIKTLEAGSVTINGSMQSYDLLIDSAATIEQLERVTFKANIDLASDKLNVKQLDATLLGGSVITNGKVSFVDGINALGTTRVTNINASPLVPSLSSVGIPNASWEYVTQQSPSGIILLITNLNGVGEVDKHLINIDGQIAYYQAQDLAVANLSIKQQDTANKIELLAQILNKQKLSINSTIALPKPSKLLDGLNGSVTGNINVLGTWENPEFSVDLAANEFVVAPNISEFLSGQGSINSQIKGSGTLQDHTLRLSTTLRDYGIDLALTGGMKDNRYTGEITTANTNVLTTRWALSKSLRFDYDIASQSAHIFEHCWGVVENTGKLCVEQASYQNQQAPWNIKWSINASALPIGQWAQQAVSGISQVSESAILNFSTKGQYNIADELIVDGQLNVEESTWMINSNNPVRLTLNTMEAKVAINKESASADMLFSSKEVGSISATAVIDSQAIFNGNMDANVDSTLTVNNITLKPLAGLSPSIHRLEGVINGQIKVAGRIKKPTLEGKLTLQDGYIDAEQSPLALSKWNQTFLFKDQEAQIDGEFTLGDGSGVLNGLLSWEHDPYAELNVKADNISLAYEESKLRISPDLSAKITTDEISVEGDLNIPYARIKLKQLPKSAVAPSRDVHLWGEERSTDPIKNIVANINVNIDKAKDRDVKLDAFGLTANLYGELQIQNQPSTVGYGDLQILDGRYKAYGQNLIIRTGEVQFNGPIGQPFLFVEAIRDPDLTEDDVIAGVRIDGPASGPGVTLFSEPTMSQSENLLYLINGSGNLSSSGESGGTNYGALLLGLGLSQSGRITNSVGNALGIQDLSFSTTGQGSESQVSLSGNITKDLSVRFGVGLSEGQEVAVRYRILPHLYLEAVRQLTTAVSLIDLFYEFSLGDPAKANEKEEEQK